jgi:hypothetical protein
MMTRRLFESAGMRGARLRAQAVTVILIAFTALLALEQLGFAAQFIMALGITVVAGAGLAIALAFGLGCRELARDFVVEYLRSIETEGPRRPEFMTATPFELTGVVHLVYPAGFEVHDLEELRLALETVPERSLFHHTAARLLRHPAIAELPPDDLSHWVSGVVQDRQTGERMSFAPRAPIRRSRCAAPWSTCWLRCRRRAGVRTMHRPADISTCSPPLQFPCRPE